MQGPLLHPRSVTVFNGGEWCNDPHPSRRPARHPLKGPPFSISPRDNSFMRTSHSPILPSLPSSPSEPGSQSHRWEMPWACVGSRQSEVLVVSWCLSVMSGNTCHSSTRETLLCHEDWLIYAPAADAKKKMLGACAIRKTILAELSLGQSAFLATNPKAVFRHFCLCPRPFAHTEKYNYLCPKNILFLSPPKPD